MNVPAPPVDMGQHVLMESTITDVAVPLDTLAPTVKQVSKYTQVNCLYQCRMGYMFSQTGI